MIFDNIYGNIVFGCDCAYKHSRKQKGIIMNRVLENLEPKDVFNFFEDICNIPHISYHTELISDYCEKFAKDRNLRYVRDEAGNIIIYKDAAPGYENAPTVIIQGHLDMVGAKSEDCEHDFLKDPLKLLIENGYVTADGTTLGADDGVAVAMSLAILDNTSLKHPPLEVVLTVDEEVGLYGAEAVDASLLKGKYLINLDSDGEGVFLTGSAGGLDSDLTLNVNMVEFEGQKVELTICNLTGGHSGVEIGTGRPSANVLMGRLLKELSDFSDYYIISIKGGEVDNAICQKCVAEIAADSDDINAISEVCCRVMKELRSEYRGIDDNITIVCNEKEFGTYNVSDDFGQEKIICLLRNLPYGVIARSAYDINLVETSLNLGVMRFEEGTLHLIYSVRSSIESAKKEIAGRLEYLTEFLGGTYNESGDYPSWTYNPDSQLREIISKTYEKMYGKKPCFTTIHAGLECGIFSDKIPGVDIVSYGPNMKDIHTFDEKLSIESTKRVYEFTLNLLENIRS